MLGKSNVKNNETNGRETFGDGPKMLQKMKHFKTVPECFKNEKKTVQKCFKNRRED
ncbi:hypothetical protein IKO50_07435 [bacterium]|nr:hypothetical protein [bacterium]